MARKVAGGAKVFKEIRSQIKSLEAEQIKIAANLQQIDDVIRQMHVRSHEIDGAIAALTALTLIESDEEEGVDGGVVK